MNNFKLIGAIDPLPMLGAIERNLSLWDSNRARTASPTSPHRDAHDIILRQNPAGLGGPIDKARNLPSTVNDLTRVDYPAMEKFSAVFDHIRWQMSKHLLFMGHEVKETGSVVIAALPPGGRIYEHVDYDDPKAKAALYWDRFHVMLQYSHLFTIDDETCGMDAGEVWWIDTSKPHTVRAGDKDHRITLVVDLHLDPPMPRTTVLPDGMLRPLV